MISPLLSQEELLRYERQLILSSWSEEAQVALKKTAINLPVDAWLGAAYLAAAGAGQIILLAGESLPLPLRSHLVRINSQCHLRFCPPADPHVDEQISNSCSENTPEDVLDRRAELHFTIRFLSSPTGTSIVLHGEDSCLEGTPLVLRREIQLDLRGLSATSIPHYLAVVAAGLVLKEVRACCNSRRLR